MKYLSFIAIIILFVSCNEQKIPEKGVSLSLAAERKIHIDSLSYFLEFSIPELKNEKLEGKNTIRFFLKTRPEDIILDFKETADKLQNIKVGGETKEFIFLNEHIVLKAKYFNKGWNEIELTFIAGDLSLNRQEEFMYTLFVPDRARTAFPCFDQPDLKANFNLRLELPKEWTACANGKEISNEVVDERRKMSFEKTRPLSTYLFAFAAGKFNIIEHSKNGFNVRLFHRESDQSLLDSNTDEIFRQVFSSIEWMEKYTGIPYPFAKYDLIAIPSFQYGGMEHTGATLYRSNKIFLPLSPTDNQLLSRANLIAHETAHMWFGDFVTMKWFNEVWLKEVFANFIAEKITNPWFPEMNHDLKFLLAHYPASYEIDRSKGANPIQQKLDNLENAGTVYGSIIYHKAPLVMRKLEEITGVNEMQESLREYLSTYAYKNAGWNDLINILDSKTDVDLKNWSRVWVEEPGMPDYEIKFQNNDSVSISQEDPLELNRVWMDRMSVLFDFNQTESFSSFEPISLGYSEDMIFNEDGFCYGSFQMDEKYVTNYLEKFANIYSQIPEITKASQWMILYENLLDNKIPPLLFMKIINEIIPMEENNLILQQMLSMQSIVYWDLLSLKERLEESTISCDVLWRDFEGSKDSRQKMIFDQLLRIENEMTGLQKLKKIWSDGYYGKMKLSEFDQVESCYELCLKIPEEYESLYKFQLARTMNTDRQQSLNFIIPFIIPDENKRYDSFQSLKDEKNRQIESDVITALSFLTHPLRREHSVQFLPDCLEILPDIQMTGDIFFPKRWLDAAFSNQNSDEACRIVDEFLKSKPDLPMHLKLKILQSTDLMYRANRIISRG